MRVALFDLDDTLFDHFGAVGAGITDYLNSGSEHVGGNDPAACSAVGLSVSGVQSLAADAAEVARWRGFEEHHYPRYLSGELSYHGQRRARARDFVVPFGIDLSVDSMADTWFNGYFSHYVAHSALHTDALSCLATLGAAGYRIGVITNGDLAFQTAKIERIGLAPFVEHIVASGEFGVAKPDPRIFAHACSLFGVSPDSVSYTGDRLATDALGAAAAGLRGVWLDRPGGARPGELAAAAASGIPVIRGLDELPDLLS